MPFDQPERKARIKINTSYYNCTSLFSPLRYMFFSYPSTRKITHFLFPIKVKTRVAKIKENFIRGMFADMSSDMLSKSQG